MSSSDSISSSNALSVSDISDHMNLPIISSTHVNAKPNNVDNAKEYSHISTPLNLNESTGVPNNHSIFVHRSTSKNSPKSDRHVSFGLVDLYHFDRLQGFTCVPSQGGSTLGMASEHWNKECVSVSEHQSRRKHQRHSALLRFCLEGKLLLSFQQFRMLESRVKHQQRLMTLKADSAQSSGISTESVSSNLKRSHEVPENPRDEDLGFLDGLEEYYFLQPLPVKRRRIMLRKAGLTKIDSSEKQECEEIRKSRTECGCTCVGGVCDPYTCECALNGIPCQVDRASFPCVCLSPRNCANPEGRVEFNPMRVRTHYLHTRLRLESEERADNALPSGSKRIRLCESDSEDLEEGQISSSSSSTYSYLVAGCSRRSIEEALNATAPNGGCRDCQDDRYVRLLLQELQGQQAQQDRITCIRDSLEVDKGDFTDEGDAEGSQNEGRSRPLQGMLSDNLAVDSVSFTNAVPSSLEVEEGNHDYTSVLFNTEDEDYEDEECQDEYDEDSEEDDVFRQDDEGRHQIISSLNETFSSAPETSGAGSCCSSEESNSSSLCRLEPITSLFHSPSGSSPEIGEDGSTTHSPTTSNSASSQTASVCEVVMG
nr:cysteine:serine rich nuclear protein 3 [Hymenolepis microstoma]